jgi:hypothetical protein
MEDAPGGQRRTPGGEACISGKFAHGRSVSAVGRGLPRPSAFTVFQSPSAGRNGCADCA